MKITASVTKSSHQDRGPCYSHLPIISYTSTLLYCCKMKSCCDHCFPQKIRPQITVQLYIARDYCLVRVGFNMINKRRTLSKFRSFVFYSELNEVCGNYVWILKWVNLHCYWINLISVLSFPEQLVADYRWEFRIQSKIYDEVFNKKS